MSRWIVNSVGRGVASSEAEVRGVVEGLGRVASSEAEIAPRVLGGCEWAVLFELGRGPSAKWASLSPFLSFVLEGDCWP